MNRIQMLLAAALAATAVSALAHEHAGGPAHAGASEREQTEWGIAAAPKAAHRTIRIVMADNMRFTPANIEVRQGETVQFEVHNDGKMLHEMVIGTKKELEEHAALMRKFPGMEHHDAWMTHVEPGQTGEITWTFNRPGSFQFACLVPGHYETGMRGDIRVVPRHGQQH